MSLEVRGSMFSGRKHGISIEKLRKYREMIKTPFRTTLSIWGCSANHFPLHCHLVASLIIVFRNQETGMQCSLSHWFFFSFTVGLQKKDFLLWVRHLKKTTHEKKSHSLFLEEGLVKFSNTWTWLRFILIIYSCWLHPTSWFSYSRYSSVLHCSFAVCALLTHRNLGYPCDKKVTKFLSCTGREETLIFLTLKQFSSVVCVQAYHPICETANNWFRKSSHSQLEASFLFTSCLQHFSLNYFYGFADTT